MAAIPPAIKTDEERQQEYWDKLLIEAGNISGLGYPINLLEENEGTAQNRTRIWYEGEELQGLPQDLLQTHTNATTIMPDRNRLCVIENVRPSWIKALGEEWKIDPLFFVFFMANSGREGDWALSLESIERHYHLSGRLGIGPPTSAQSNGATAVPARSVDKFPVPSFRTIRGNFLAPSDAKPKNWIKRQHSFVESDAVVRELCSKIRTCISWCRLGNLIVCLVDSPPEAGSESHWGTRITLQIESTAHPGGHRAAHILCGPSSPFPGPRELLCQFLGEPIVMGMLAKTDSHGGGHATFWMITALMNYSWARALNALESEVYDISFHEVREPDMKTNDRLHRNRENLWGLKAAVLHSRFSWSCWTTEGNDHGLAGDKARVKKQLSPAELHYFQRYVNAESAAMLRAIDRQEDVLVQTFQILLSTITIQESQLAIQQSRRAALLTWLAFIYAPLSFICGIFGMNVKEINGSPLSVWTVVVAFMIVMVCTLALFAAYKIWDKRKPTTGTRQFWTFQSLRRSNVASQKDPAKLV